MTEAEWLSGTSPWSMMDHLGYLQKRASDRKLRLLAVACCRLIWPFLSDERSRHAVEVAERYADGLAGREDLKAAWRAAGGAARVRRRHADYGTPQAIARDVALVETTHAVNRVIGQGMQQTACDLLRDIFGNPFRPVAVEQSWLTPTVVQLAGAIYAERGFGDLPVLTDALEEAGCTNADVIVHCRGPGPHARGCWLIDTLLGKMHSG
jgi:hypothetical protein